MTQPIKYIVHDNVVYEEKSTPFITSFIPQTVKILKPQPLWHGPKIPWEMWRKLTAWCQVTQTKFGSEALAYLFFDSNTSEWATWFLPQITQGMTVKADTKNPQFKIQRKNYCDLQFGTLHHHCTSGAFASGTDKDDEVDRDGFHFTIGNLGEKEHSVHFRFSLGGIVTEHPAHEWVEPCTNLAHLPANIQKVAHELMVKSPIEDLSEFPFKDELKNITKPVPRAGPRPTTHTPYDYALHQTKLGWENLGYDPAYPKQHRNLLTELENWTLGTVLKHLPVLEKASVISEVQDYIDCWLAEGQLTVNTDKMERLDEVEVCLNRSNYSSSSEYLKFREEIMEICLFALDYQKLGELDSIRSVKTRDRIESWAVASLQKIIEHERNKPQ
tara:strand:+ start:2206 stop:3363 length:1158 start_codon:yes stop_codon:yes gene_type:complete